ncbi:ABC transporter ATP-binding protein [bacterium]|nr:ABC transporter ATP-binding protein [bacterium]
MFSIKNLRHRYGEQFVLNLPEFEGAQGEHWLLLGLSGSGKSTLLHIMAGVLHPSQGSVKVVDQDLSQLNETSLDRFRGRNIGVVFQQMHLVSSLTVGQNLALAQYMAGVPQDRRRIREVLASLDILEKENVHPAKLSHGQQQRVAIARAVMNEPRIILADEPTSALDDLHNSHVLDLLLQQATICGATLVIATHDQRVKEHFSNKLDLDTINHQQQNESD